MKKTVLLLFTLFTITIYCQTEIGNFYIGANSNLNFSKSNSSFENQSENHIQTAENVNKFSQFNLNAEVGYFLIDNLTSGINVNFSRINPDDSPAQNIYTVSPFLKYYFLDNNIKPFARISYGFGKIKDNYISTPILNDPLNNVINHADTDINVINAGIGLAYFINSNFSIELIFNYSQSTYTTETSNFKSEQITDVFNSNLGFSIFL